jgi:hypothetical protein
MTPISVVLPFFVDISPSPCVVRGPQVSIQPPTYDRNSGNSLRSSQPPKAATDPPPAIHADDYTLHQDNDSHEPDSELSASENNVQTATANSAHVGVAASISPSQSPSVSKSASRSEAVSSSISETSTPSLSQSAARSRDTVLDSLVMQRRPARPKRHGGMNIIAPPLDPTSSKTCVMIGSWSETCVYRNMCYDTENWYLIRNDVDPDISVEEQEPFYPYNDFQTGIVYPQSPIPPVGRDFFPYQDGGNLVSQLSLLGIPGLAGPCLLLCGETRSVEWHLTFGFGFRCVEGRASRFRGVR